jgi:hypothetical protein
MDDFPEQGAGGGKGNIWHLRVTSDGERARIRFLTEGNEFFYSWFHRLEVNGKYQGDKLCVKYEYEQECDLCADQVKSTFLWLAWVYVDYQDYAETAQGRKPIQRGKRTMYRAEIKEARLMKYAGAHKGSVKTKIDFLDEKNESLLDYEFDWTRSGEKGSTRPSYALDWADQEKVKLPFPKELADLLADLPDLESVAQGVQVSQTKKSGAAAKKSAFDDEIVNYKTGDDQAAADLPFDEEPEPEVAEGDSNDLF